jgi:hypothetical protein
MPAPNIISGPDDYVAVAFADLDGDGKFHFKKDGLIAAIIDEDGSGDVTVGDTVTFGHHYDFNLGIAGTFTGDDATISFVQPIQDQPDGIQTNAGGQAIFWVDAPDSEIFQIGHPASFTVQIVDLFEGVFDHVKTVAGSVLAEPNSTIDQSADQLGDQDFLDVIIVQE